MQHSATHVYIQQVAWIRCEYGPCRQAEMGVMQTWDSGYHWKSFMRAKPEIVGQFVFCWKLLEPPIGDFVVCSCVNISCRLQRRIRDLTAWWGKAGVRNSSDQPWYASCVAYRSMVSTYRVFPSVFLWRYMTILYSNWQTDSMAETQIR